MEKTNSFKSLLLVLIAAMLPQLASAHDFWVDGLYYKKNSDGISVTVTYYISSSHSYSNLIGALYIPRTVVYSGTSYLVTSIDNNAFEGCSGLASVTIPNSVTSIGNGAFCNCRSLNSLTLSNSVTTIGKNSFKGCSGLTSLTIPNSVTTIDITSFNDCSGLTSIVVESGNAKYDSRNNCNAIIETATNTLFNGCKNTTIPHTVKSIGNKAFFGCSGLTSVTIPNSVTSIGMAAFLGCTGLTSVTIPNSVTSIGQSAFQNCPSLISVKIGNSVTSIGGYAFMDCTGLTDVTIGNSVTTIGDGAFYGCRGLTEVTIPNSVTSIGGDAFFECSGLTSVTIPNSVTSIGGEAFFGCSGLTSVTIPNSVTSIGGSAFQNCPSLISVKIGNSVTSIGGYAFSGCTGLISLSIGNSVTQIGNYAFADCTGLTSIYCYIPTPFSIPMNVFSRYNANLYVEPSSVSAYKSCFPWNKFNVLSYDSSVLATGISLNKTYLSLEVGCTETLIATVTPSNVTNNTVSWKSSNISVATVDQNGKVTAKAAGTANITATTVDGTNLSATCNLTVTSPEGNTITIGNGTVQDETVPIYNWQMSSFIGSECLYLKNQLADLKAGDKITSIAFYLMSGYAYGGNFNVRMKNTSISSLKNNADADDTSCIEVNYSDQVNGNVTLEPYSGGQWINFPLSTPFVYSGGNIIIDIRNTTPGARSSLCYFATTTYNGVRRSLVWNIAKSENPHADGFNGGGIFGYENSSNLPNIIITYAAGDVYATGISLNKSSTSIHVGETETLVATVTPSNTTNKTVFWKSSNTSVATVDQNGKVTAKAVGTANITATTTDGTNLSDACIVTITSPTVLATGISLNKTSMILDVGDTETLVATVTPSDVTNGSVTWSSSNNNVATVDDNGMVTAKSAGTANITATTVDGTNLTATCQVTVIPSPQIVENTITIGDGTVQDERVPICNWHMNSYIGSECLYVKDQLADLKVGDKITSIAFYLMSGNAHGGNFNVRMKNTSISSLKNNADAFDTSCIEVNYNDQVNGNVTLEPYSGGQWIYFPLSTPFVYSGGNIIIDIRNTIPKSMAGRCYFATTTYYGERRSFLWHKANSENPHADGFNGGGIFGYDNSSNLPNIHITYLTTIYEIPGDVNGDGHVSSVDVTALYNYLLNGDDSNIVNGDVDGDGHISSVDITAVYNVLLGN